MGERQVGVRELKAKLSQYLREAKAGRTVVVTERGKPVASLTPPPTSIEQRLEELERAGMLVRGKGKYCPKGPVARVLEGHSVSDLVIEDRG
jgi:prevent-host-death family protein